jgi:hypothetical protein
MSSTRRSLPCSTRRPTTRTGTTAEWGYRRARHRPPGECNRAPSLDRCGDGGRPLMASSECGRVCISLRHWWASSFPVSTVRPAGRIWTFHSAGRFPGEVAAVPRSGGDTRSYGPSEHRSTDPCSGARRESDLVGGCTRHNLCARVRGGGGCRLLDVSLTTPRFEFIGDSQPD